MKNAPAASRGEGVDRPNFTPDTSLDQNRQHTIEAELKRRGIAFKRPRADLLTCRCPKCGSERFTILHKSNGFCCGGCSATGSDTDAFVRFLDGDAAPKLKPKTNGNGNGARHDKQPDTLTVSAPVVTAPVAAAPVAAQKPKPEPEPNTLTVAAPVAEPASAPVAPAPKTKLIGKVTNGNGNKQPDVAELQAWATRLGWTLDRDGRKWSLWKDANNPELCGQHTIEVPVVLKRAAETLAELENDPGAYDHLSAPREPAPPPPITNTDTPITISNTDLREIVDENEIKAEIERLASLSDLVYQTTREAAARSLGMRAGALDRFVRAARKPEEINEDEAPLHPHWIVEPWSEPVAADVLVGDLVARIRKHLVCPPENALTVALWIVFAWCHDKVATHSPILNISSPEAESGKSSMLGLVSFLIPRAISSVDITGAPLFRSIELWQPSFVIDEFDTALASDDASALRSVINSGHTRGQGVVRCVEPDFRPRLFKTFCPKAIGMIGRRLPSTTLSRCIIVELLRRREDEDIEKFNHVDDAGLSDLRSRLLRWSIDNADDLIASKNTVAMPDGFGNRRADNWRVLFAIADLAGVGDQARGAAAKIEGSADNTSIRVRALIDIRSFVYPKDGDGRELEPLDRISSGDLVAWLASMPEGPWAAWGKRGKPITQAELAFLIKGFGIAPEVIRFPSGGTSRGYLRTQFEDAWDRYLPPSAR